jgi:hypothetical protein
MIQWRQPYLPLAAFIADTISSTEYPMPVPRLNTEYSPNPFRIKRDKKREKIREKIRKRK